MRKLTWLRKWIAFSWVGELCWCTCAVRQESRGGTRGRAGSSAVRSELCGLGGDSVLWLDGLSLAMSLSSVSIPPKLYCLVPYQEHLLSVCISWALVFFYVCKKSFSPNKNVYFTFHPVNFNCRHLLYTARKQPFPFVSSVLLPTFYFFLGDAVDSGMMLS